MMKLILLCGLVAVINAQANLQGFPEALGGVTAPAVTQVGNQFQVEGNSLINTLSSALDRSCAVQHNKCANAANAGGNKTLKVSDCDAQQGRCNAFQQGAGNTQGQAQAAPAQTQQAQAAAALPACN